MSSGGEDALPGRLRSRLARLFTWAHPVAVRTHESLLDALAHAGHPLPPGCREGVCGSCELTVVGGEPEHRDDIGAPPARMDPCVSRAVGPRPVGDV